METTTNLPTKELQRICVVILKNDFSVDFSQIAEVLNIKSHEAKELYLQLIRKMENHELQQKTQTTN